MAQHKSAKKRIRRNERARAQNRQYLSTVRSAVKKFRAAAASVSTGAFDKANLRPLLVDAQSLLTKAVNKGIIHRNNASRKVARLTHLLSRTENMEVSAPVAAEKKAAKKAAPAKRPASKKA